MASAADRTLHVLTGATAVGKTEWALRWAEANDAEIISCDSLLFYRGMNVGTAKPNAQELSRVRHHLIDLLPVREAMNIARYAELAQAAVADIAARGRRILITGGSGFYLKSFFTATTDQVEVPDDIRVQVAALEAAGGVEALVAELERHNPLGLGTLDQDNPRRVARALERCLASGRPLADLQADFAALPAPFPGWRLAVVQLDRPREALAPRIEARVRAMLAKGLVEEVRGLLAQGLADNPSASRAIGYREVIEVLAGTAPEPGLAERIAANTRALVKKQRTWFRTQLPPHAVIDPGTGNAADLFADLRRTQV